MPHDVAGLGIHCDNICDVAHLAALCQPTPRDQRRQGCGRPVYNEPDIRVFVGAAFDAGDHGLRAQIAAHCVNGNDYALAAGAAGMLGRCRHSRAGTSAGAQAASSSRSISLACATTSRSS